MSLLTHTHPFHKESTHISNPADSISETPAAPYNLSRPLNFPCSILTPMPGINDLPTPILEVDDLPPPPPEEAYMVTQPSSECYVNIQSLPLEIIESLPPRIAFAAQTTYYTYILAKSYPL